MSWVLCFHDILMGIIIFIGVLVFGLIVIVWSSHNVFISYIHDEPLEVAWTVFPIRVFLFLAFPSISLLYLGDKREGGATSTNYVKAVAHQWY
jgi:heme/copper-type cytochrome/quinol oxidase subunit 2